MGTRTFTSGNVAVTGLGVVWDFEFETQMGPRYTQFLYCPANKLFAIKTTGDVGFAGVNKGTFVSRLKGWLKECETFESIKRGLR